MISNYLRDVRAEGKPRRPWPPPWAARGGHGSPLCWLPGRRARGRGGNQDAVPAILAGPFHHTGTVRAAAWGVHRRLCAVWVWRRWRRSRCRIDPRDFGPRRTYLFLTLDIYKKKVYFLSLFKPRICFSFEFIMKLYTLWVKLLIKLLGNKESRIFSLFASCWV